MALPKQVQKDIADIEEMERQMAAPVDPAPAEPVDEHPATPDPALPAEPTTAVESPTEPPAPVADPPNGPTPADDWEQKYNRLQGKFRTEVSELHKQNKDLLAQVQQMQEQIAAVTKAQTPEKPTEPERLVTPKDEESFGADLIDVQRRVAREVFAEYVTPLQAQLAARDAKIADLEARLDKTGGDLSNMTFEQRLYKLVPDFDAVNADPKWIAWLEEVDPLTSEPRRAFATYAYTNGLAEKVATVVNLFKEQTAPAPTPSAASTQADAELNRQVQPTRSATTSTPPKPGDKTYTEAEWNRLWVRVTELARAGKVEESERLETELTVAATQGRVR